MKDDMRKCRNRGVKRARSTWRASGGKILKGREKREVRKRQKGKVLWVSSMQTNIDIVFRQREFHQCRYIKTPAQICMKKIVDRKYLLR